MPKSPSHWLSMSFRDVSEEPASSKVYTKAAATGVQVEALRSAVEDLSGLRMKVSTVAIDTVISVLAGVGKRELRTLVRFHDSVTGDKFTLNIPGANGILTLLPSSDFVDPTDTRYVAFKTAFEAAGCTYFTENTVVLDSIEITRGQK